MPRQLDQAEAATPDEGPPSPELLLKAQELLDNIELYDIRPRSLNAMIEETAAPGTHVASVRMDFASAFAAEKGVYGNLFEYRFELFGDDADAALGKIEFSLLLDYQVGEGYEPDFEAAEYVAGTTGYFAAYPYARELFQSLAGRLQFDPIVVGLLKKGTMRPGMISVVPSPSVYADPRPEGKGVDD